VYCAAVTTAATLLLLQGTTTTGQDITLMVKTLGHRVLTPLALWNAVPNRRFNAATKRFDALATGLILEEKAKLAAVAAADANDTSTSTSSSSSVKDSCLLTQLVQYGEGDASDTAATAASEGPRNVLTSEEVRALLHAIVIIITATAIITTTAITSYHLHYYCYHWCYCCPPLTS
jgi:hypothetical protein